MTRYLPQELAEAHRALLSTLKKCEKVLESPRLLQAQRTLTQRRVRALEIALELIEKEAAISGIPPSPHIAPPQ
jgi:predicted RNA binding protein with dsRBD fold (UPF0201 family)